MSFSLSRLRRTLRSTSIGLHPQVLELDLNLPWPELGVAELAAFTVDLEGHPGRPGRDDPALDGA